MHMALCSALEDHCLNLPGELYQRHEVVESEQEVNV